MSAHSGHPLQGHGGRFWLAVLLFPPALFLICWGLFEVVIRYVHYSLGVLIAFLAVVAAFGLLPSLFESRAMRAQLPDAETTTITREERGLLDKLRVMDFVISMSTSMAAVLTLITVFAWISYVFTRLGLGGPTAIARASYASLVNTYGWHLVDLVPFMNAKQSLGMATPPVLTAGWAMGAPVLAFRVLVGVLAFTSIRKVWTEFLRPDSRREHASHTSAGLSLPSSERVPVAR